MEERIRELERQLRTECAAPVSHKRVYRIMRAHNLQVARRCHRAAGADPRGQDGDDALEARTSAT